MRDNLHYKGYMGRFEFYEDEGIYYGNIQGVEDTVTFQGKSLSEVRSAFEDSVDEYLRFCFEIGKSPEKPQL